jgi:hypothetical protein
VIRGSGHSPNLLVSKFPNKKTHLGVSINGETPKWMVYNGKSCLEMDDDWGYPDFRKPPCRSSPLTIFWFQSFPFLIFFAKLRPSRPSILQSSTESLAELKVRQQMRWESANRHGSSCLMPLMFHTLSIHLPSQHIPAIWGFTRKSKRFDS